jgi:hypothetical protein
MTWTNSQRSLNGITTYGLYTQEIFQNWDSIHSTWVNATATFYTYNADYSTDHIDYDSWDTASRQWQIQYRTQYDFSQNFSYISMRQNYVNGSFVNIYRDTTTLDGRYVATSDIIQTWDSLHMTWTNDSLILYAYDLNQYVTQKITNHWINGSWQPGPSDQLINYYYEQYSPVSGIAEIRQTGSLSIYPSPATDMAHISLSWDSPQAATLAIYDASGRLWRQWTAPEAVSYQGSISLSTLPTGIYYLHVRGRDAELSRSFSIAK